MSQIVEKSEEPSNANGIYRRYSHNPAERLVPAAPELARAGCLIETMRGEDARTPAWLPARSSYPVAFAGRARVTTDPSSKIQ